MRLRLPCLLPLLGTLILALAVRGDQPAPRTVAGLGLELVPIAPGSFVMGCPDDEPGRSPNEGPPTQVAITRSFWLGKFEVTHGQWKAIMGTDLLEQARRLLADPTRHSFRAGLLTILERYGNPADLRPAALVGDASDDVAMYWINWEEADEFCRRLTERERAAGRLPAGYVYRLPTEAEREYACRAGTTGAHYATGGQTIDDIAWHSGNSSDGYAGPGWVTGQSGWTWSEQGRAGPRRVGLKAPNAWGLYDMLGNVWEHCADGYVTNLPGGSLVDPCWPQSDHKHTAKGGGWNNRAGESRASERTGTHPTYRIYNLGFRVALAPALVTASAR